MFMNKVPVLSAAKNLSLYLYVLFPFLFSYLSSITSINATTLIYKKSTLTSTINFYFDVHNLSVSL